MTSFLPELKGGAHGARVRRAGMARMWGGVVAVVVTMAAAPAHAVGTWETTLQGRDLDGDASTFEAYYDTALNITWLADANYAFTSGYTSADSGGVEPGSGGGRNVKWTDGQMSWDAAKAWAAGLNVFGVTGWRLPTLADTSTPGCEGGDCGLGVASSSNNWELAHLYYVTLGNNFHDIDPSLPPWHPAYDRNRPYDLEGSLNNKGPFWTIPNRSSYWSGVEFASNPGVVWKFDTFYGWATYDGSGDVNFAWAVRSGDVTGGGSGPVMGDPGFSPLDPILPRFVDGTPGSSVVFEFDDISVIRGGLGAPDGPPIWIDPEVAVGYRFDVSGNTFQSVTLPSLGDLDGYLLQVWLSGVWVDVATLLDGGSFTFDSGVNTFRIMGINPTLALDPANPNAFVTGVNFGQTGVASVTMTPITAMVPEPQAWALALAGGLVLARVRRRTRSSHYSRSATCAGMSVC